MKPQVQNKPFRFAYLLTRMSIMLKVQAILQDGSVGLEFMTEDAAEAEEMGYYYRCLLLKAWPKSGYWTNRDGWHCEATLR